MERASKDPEQRYLSSSEQSSKQCKFVSGAKINTERHMYSLKIEAQKRAVLGTQTPEDELDDGTAALRDALEADLAEGAVEFSIGNPRVEHITGVVHLYRDFPVPAPQQVARAAGTAGGGGGGAWGNSPSELGRPPVFSLPEGRGPTICCLAIPADMSMADFCNFCGAYLEAIRSMRVLRREARSQVVCMVLIRFANQQLADDFYKHFNQKPFSSLEPEIVCRLVWVRAVELVGPDGRHTTNTPTTPDMQVAPAQRHQQQQHHHHHHVGSSTGGGKGGGNRAGGSKAPAPSSTVAGVGRGRGRVSGSGQGGPASTGKGRHMPSNAPTSHASSSGCGADTDSGSAATHDVSAGCMQSGGGGMGGAASTELPSCPVCLERLDEYISGIVTTVCNHQFHSECLQKWGDTSCPVCRYCSQPDTHASQCRVCGASADLWICLICGHVGCGRYRAGHASDHWKGSSHCYALDLDTQRVWDYVGDNYVHRLIQSKTDGKLVEVPSPGPQRPQRNAKHRGSSKNGGQQQQHSGRRGRRKSQSQEGCASCGRPSTSRRQQVSSSGSSAAATAEGPVGVAQQQGQQQQQQQQQQHPTEGMHGCQHCSSSGSESEYEHWDDDGYDSYEQDERDRMEAEQMQHAIAASKLDHIAAEYNHLLASQLDNQRAYFEGLILDQAAEMEQRLAAASKAAAAAEEAAAAARAASKDSERRRQGLEKKLADSVASCSKASEERNFLRSLNDQLLSNQKQLRLAAEGAKGELAGRDATIRELQEQVRDLMFFIEGQRTIAEAGGGSELQQGTVLPLPASQPRKGRKGGR